MNRSLRIAFLPDSFDEVNGVAHTARQFERFAETNQLPFLIIHSGARAGRTTRGRVTRLTYPRGPVSFGLDRDLRFDLAFLRHYRAIARRLKRFRPDVVHITGPSDVGIAGTIAAHQLGIPLAASWHTNLHEYAGRRWAGMLNRAHVPGSARSAAWIEQISFDLTARYYRLAHLLFAPNRELVSQLESATGKPCFTMSRGVDTAKFSPCHRRRTDEEVVIGYVGRLTQEKNVSLLHTVEQELIAAGCRQYRFVLVGQGSEEPWLRENLKQAKFTGVLRGNALAEAYANMDLFAFPSATDTFGNVVLEAMASGVPAVVTSGGGPKFIVNSGTSGVVTATQHEFVTAIRQLIQNGDLRRRMGAEAREQALLASWQTTFEEVYRAYQHLIDERAHARYTIGAAPAGAF